MAKKRKELVRPPEPPSPPTAAVGGTVTLSQQGERAAKRGCLRGAFRPRLVGHVLAKYGAVVDPGEEGEAAAPEVVIDFRPTSLYDEHVEQVVKRLGDGALMAVIAEEPRLTTGGAKRRD